MPPKRYRKLDGSDTLTEQIRALAEAGWRPSAIGRAIDRSTTYVCVVLNQLRKAGRLPPRA